MKKMKKVKKMKKMAKMKKEMEKSGVKIYLVKNVI